MLDKNTKYIYLNEEKYKASYKQSMSTGMIFFEVNVTAGTQEELKNESEQALTICIDTCNLFNKQQTKKEKSPHIPKEEKKPEVKGLD